MGGDVLSPETRAFINRYINPIGLDLPTNAQRRANVERSKAAADTPVGRSGALTGEVAATLPAFAATGGATSALPLTQRLLAQAATGATVGSATALDDRTLAGIVSGLGAGAGKLLGSALTSGLVRLGPKAEALLKAGIQPTLGDIMKEGNAAQKAIGSIVRGTEATAERLPLGETIQSKLPLTKARLADRKKADAWLEEEQIRRFSKRNRQKKNLKEYGKVADARDLLTNPAKPNYEAQAVAALTTGGASLLSPKIPLAAVPLTVFPKDHSQVSHGSHRLAATTRRRVGRLWPCTSYRLRNVRGT